jgi:hypothetical protein
MADRRDDIDSWLSERIEPLSPPPGTFELIKRRARRRKLARLALTASAAAVVVAAAVTVPQVVNLTVTPGPTTGAAAAGRSAATPTPKPTSSTEATAASPAFVPAPGAVPPSFRPTSVTFVGVHTGWVIGQAGTPGQCASPYCTSVARTNDAGTSWTGVSAPKAGVPDGATGVSQIRFLNTSDGWAFGPELFATHDGGRTWTRVATHGLRVTGLETVGERAFAIFASCTGTGLEFAAKCTSFTLYSSPASADDWTPAGGPTSGLAGGPASLVLTGARGYLLGPDGTLYAGPVTGGAAWQRAGALPATCDVGPAQLGGQPSGVMFGAVDAAQLILACTSANAGQPSRQKKLIFSSTDAGASWRPLPAAPQAGVAFSIAASPQDTVILGTDRGIEVLPAGATAWQAAALAGAGPAGGFGFVGMTTSEQGVALPANPKTETVWFTFDGGQTWRPTKVS